MLDDFSDNHITGFFIGLSLDKYICIAHLYLWMFIQNYNNKECFYMKGIFSCYQIRNIYWFQENLIHCHKFSTCLEHLVVMCKHKYVCVWERDGWAG